MAENTSTEACLVDCCPECDRQAVRPVVGSPFGGNQVDHDYYCGECSARFDEPAQRERDQDPGRPSGLAGELYDADPEDVGEPVTDGGVIPAADSEYYSDGSFTTCPDCGGELQYQNRESVTCQDCATEFGHYKRTNGLNTLLRAPDNDRAAQVYDPGDDQCRDAELVTDGGQEIVYLPSANCNPAQTYHRDRACQYLRRASSVVQKPLSVLPERVEPCSNCAGDDQRVLVSSSAGTRGNTTYHTDPDCGYVQRMADTVRKPLSVLGDSYEPCSDCVTGDADRGGDYEETYTCDYCGETYRSLPAALRCCGDRFAEGDGEIVTDGGQEPDPLDRLFVEDVTDRPDEIVVENLTTLDADAFVARLASLAEAAETVSQLAEDLERLRRTGLSDDDARDLLYGRNAGLAKRDIEAMFDAIDQLRDGRTKRDPTERLLAEVSGLSLSETEELMTELDRLNRRYGGNDGA